MTHCQQIWICCQAKFRKMLCYLLETKWFLSQWRKRGWLGAPVLPVLSHSAGDKRARDTWRDLPSACWNPVGTTNASTKCCLCLLAADPQAPFSLPLVRIKEPSRTTGHIIGVGEEMQQEESRGKKLHRLLYQWCTLLERHTLITESVFQNVFLLLFII